MRPERTASGTLTVPFTVPAHACEVNAIRRELAASVRNDFDVVIAVDGHGTVPALTLSKGIAADGGPYVPLGGPCLRKTTLVAGDAGRWWVAQVVPDQQQVR